MKRFIYLFFLYLSLPNFLQAGEHSCATPEQDEKCLKVFTKIAQDLQAQEIIRHYFPDITAEQIFSMFQSVYFGQERDRKNLLSQASQEDQERFSRFLERVKFYCDNQKS